MVHVTTPLYTAEATAIGGREGKVTTQDGKLELKLAMPKGLGGPGGQFTNPEELFAAGYSACFEGALAHVARMEKKSVEGTVLHAKVTIGKIAEGEGFGLAVSLNVKIPNMDKAAAQELVNKAHQVCPYSVATRGNIDVQLTVE